MLTLYSEHISTRLEYICGIVFQDIIGVDIRLTSNIDSLNSTSACLNYSNKEIADIPFIRPQGILFETGCTTSPSHSVDTNFHFFHTESDLLDFDLLSAAFFLVSRHEEYTAGSNAFDEYGRFKSAVSLAGKSGFLERPIIDEWAFELKAILKNLFSELKFTERNYRYLCTFDIDVAYAYGDRPILREVGAVLKDLSNLKFDRISERKAVKSGAQKDPFDSYTFQRKLISEHQLETRHFFLLGDYAPLDKNLPSDSLKMKNLVESIGQFSQTGIHPSLGSHKSKIKVKKEIARLEKVTHEKVTLSRQHFLAFKMPETFRILESHGILEDYSMGYSEALGFRASTCTPHFFYDLGNDRITALKLTPIMVMDSTLKDYMKLDVEAAKDRTRGLIGKVRKVNGTFVSLWHNHTIDDYGEWNGWKDVFIETIEAAK